MARETSCHLAPSTTIPVGLVVMLAQAVSKVHVNPANPIPNTSPFNVVNTGFLLLSDCHFVESRLTWNKASELRKSSRRLNGLFSSRLLHRRFGIVEV